MKCSTLSTASLLVSLFSWKAVGSSAFVTPPRPRTVAFRNPTKIFIDKRLADMIDGESYRQLHQKDFEREWMEKNREAMLSRLHDGKRAVPDDDDPEQNMRERARDRTLARKDPQRYCADRCIATGNCDVYEDIFHFSPEEVVKFCTDCVLSDDKDECDVPDEFHELEELRSLKP